MSRRLCLLFLSIALFSCAEKPPLTLTVVGTNDVHGQLLPQDHRGGLVTVSAYVDTLRKVRAADNGAVLLIDAGDMWQGTLESNMSEGAAMVQAYNAMGYDAATIGNHEFDFGPAGPAATPSEAGHDPRGALKERFQEAEFPILSANLIDEQTGKLVDWDNVQPSVLLDVAGIRIGIIGVMTINALQRTIALNVSGLRVAPLAASIEKQAVVLRDQGAQIVIVSAHAGGICTEFQDPHDLSSCNPNSEIFEVARALPTGLVDHIVAGHQHEGVAHIVNGTSITSAYSSTSAFSRVDFSIDRKTGEVLGKAVYAPHLAVPDAEYEGRSIRANAGVMAVADAASQAARERHESKIGITLATPFTLNGNPESSLGNLFTDALYESMDVDVAIHNVAGGLRAGLPAGELTFGSVYQISPFDNRAVIIEISGHDLRAVVAEQAHRRNRAMGFTGMYVAISCTDNIAVVDIELANGHTVMDSDSVRIVVNDYIATGGDDILDDVIPEGGYAIDQSNPLTRDLFIDWLAKKGGRIEAAEFDTSQNPKWRRPKPLPKNCQLPSSS